VLLSLLDLLLCGSEAAVAAVAAAEVAVEEADEWE